MSERDVTLPDEYYAPNQQVVRADGSGPAEEGEGGTPPDTGEGDPRDALDTLTKAELLEEADEAGVDVNDGMTKAQIIEAIRAG